MKKRNSSRADIFDRLAIKIRGRVKEFFASVKAYFKRLLFPLYLFPIKLITYTAYYLVKFLIKFIFAFIGLLIETIIFPFKSLKNFLKSIFILGIYFPPRRRNAIDTSGSVILILPSSPRQIQ